MNYNLELIRKAKKLKTKNCGIFKLFLLQTRVFCRGKLSVRLLGSF